MATHIHHQVELLRSGKDSSLICRVESGWVVLCQMQFLRGYCLLLPDPVVESLNALDKPARTTFLNDMALVGDVLLEITAAERINYAIMGNAEPALHAHIVPRYKIEPKEMRKSLPWSYPREVVDQVVFDFERDRELMQSLAKAILKRL